MNPYPSVRLTGRRRTWASNPRETWLILETRVGPRGVRLGRDGDDAVAYEIDSNTAGVFTAWLETGRLPLAKEEGRA